MLGRRFAAAILCVSFAAPAHAQGIYRILGQVTDDKGTPIDGAEVSLEALYGYAAGTFAGQRTFATRTEGNGKWNLLGLKSGVWIVEAIASGYVPEIVGLPFRLLTTVSSREAGTSLTWTLPLKMERMPGGQRGETLAAALEAARAGRKAEVGTLLTRITEEMSPDYLAAAARIAIVARDFDLAHELYAKALQGDPSAYRTALGLASGFLEQRDFDSASKAFDAARARTHDKDEVRFITIALADLATIRVR